MDEPVYKSEPWVAAVIEAIGDLLIEADPERRIELRDFGVFEVKKTAKTSARNPKTNEQMVVPSRRKTHFRPGKRIREVLKTPLRDLDYDVPDDDVPHDDPERDEASPGDSASAASGSNGPDAPGPSGSDAPDSGTAGSGTAGSDTASPDTSDENS
jgi:integration host factor subunit beta